MNDDTKNLCLTLMQADTEEAVIEALQRAGYWTTPAAWRYYGDSESNFSTIFNQASRSDAALVEKIVNAVDARLIDECLTKGIDPEGQHAPQSMNDAVRRFFGARGSVKQWSEQQRTRAAQQITLAATGYKPQQGNPCFTIADAGEGQTPDRMPATFLSLPRDKSNKMRIPFVQGNFNMGGSGVLRFCGKHHLQLIVTRRNSAHVASATGADRLWGFTVVRREDSGPKGTTFTYLAPLGCDPRARRGDVLRFSADQLPLFPEGRRPYVRTAAHGTLIKLYEYDATGFKSNIILKDGLLRRLDLLLPEIMLPVRLHECRYEAGHGGSHETTLAGLSVRLDENKGDNLETGFPDTCQLTVSGEPMSAVIYAFKKDRADTYRRNEGLIFTVNGQTHGSLTTDFFRRKQVGLSLLAESILVLVDCSKMSVRSREDLFMNSRDRLSNGHLRGELELELEEVLRKHPGLVALKEQRKREEIQHHTEDSKPLETILETLIKRYPTLSNLFLPGSRASVPFKSIKVQQGTKEFTGKRYPTYFRFKDKQYGAVLQRECHINLRYHVSFDTDAENEYLRRDEDPGEFSLYLRNGERLARVENYGINVRNGTGSLTVRLPANACVGDELRFVARLTDATQVQPFENRFIVRVKQPATITGGGGGGGGGGPKKPGGEQDVPTGIELPKPILVYEADYHKYNHFTNRTALRIVHDRVQLDENGGEPQDTYLFYVNMDNLHLNRYLKYDTKTGDSHSAIRQRFVVGMVLIGMALLHDDATRETQPEGEDEQRNVEDEVASVTTALAPFLLPMIESLGSVGDEEPTLVTTAEAS